MSATRIVPNLRAVSTSAFVRTSLAFGLRPGVFECSRFCLYLPGRQQLFRAVSAGGRWARGRATRSLLPDGLLGGCFPYRGLASFPVTRVCLVLLLVLCGSGTRRVAAQSGQSNRSTEDAARTYEGIVVNQGGGFVADATIVLRRAGIGGQILATDATDSVGVFSVSTIASGDLVLAISHITFGSKLVRLSASSDRMLRISLSDRVLSHTEVEVIASRAVDRLSPVTTTNIDAQALARAPDAKDIPAQLEQQPSTTQYSENGNGLGYTYLRLRGFDQKRIAVSINGIPQNDPESFDVFWINFFDLQGSISDIQIQRGASGAFYGSTGIGGGINIVAMPYTARPRLSATAGYGAFNTRRLSVEASTGLLGNRYSAYGRLSRVESDGYRDWSWTEYWRYFVGVRRIAQRSVMTLQAFGGPQKDGLAYVGIPKAANNRVVVDEFGTEIDREFNVSAFTGDVERFRQPHVEFHHEWFPSDNVDVTQRAYWIRGVGHFDFDGSFRSANYLMLPDGVVPADDRELPLYLVRPDIPVLFRAALDQWQIGWQPSLRIRSGENVTTIGGEARLHRSLRWGRVEESEGLPAGVVGPDADARVYSVRGEKSVASVYGSHLRRLYPAVVAQADVALTYRSYRVFDEEFFGTHFSKSYAFLNPRVGVSLFPEERFGAYASIAWANREPRLKALYDGEEAGAGAMPQFARDSGGALDLSMPFVRSESVLDVEVGARARFQTWEASVTTYLMSFDDEIVPSGGLDQFGVPRTGNAPKTQHAGVELETRARVLPRTDVWANATASRNRFVDFVEYAFVGDNVVALERDGNAIAGFPEFLLNAGIRYTSQNLSVDLTVRHRGRQYVDNSNGRDPAGITRDELVVDPYTLIDATMRYRFTSGMLRGFALSADLTNLLDNQVLLFGNSGFGTPQFFPAATRHVFFSVTYSIR